MKKTIVMTIAFVCAFPFADWAQLLPSLGGVGGGQVKYLVNGTYDEDGKMVWLVDKLAGRAIDSVAVARNRFKFKGKADKDALLAIVGENKWENLFFNDGTPVIVNVNDSTLKGSALNERLSKYTIEGNAPMRELNARSEKMTEAEIIANRDKLMVEMNKAVGEMAVVANRVFKEEAGTLIPVAFAQLYFLSNGTSAYDELVKQQLPCANHPYLKKSKEDIEKMQRVKEGLTSVLGKPYTDLEMADTEGKMHKLSDLVGKGKYVFVNFWASWCTPYHVELPNVMEAYNKYHDKGLEVVGIAFDEDREAWLQAIDHFKMPWLQLSDLKGWQCAAAEPYKVVAVPDNILIDPQGTVIARAIRGQALTTALQQIFGDK